MHVFSDIQKDVELFFNDLNWTYIMIYGFVLFGIKYKEEFVWYNKLFENNESLRLLKVWIAGVIIMTFFVLFKTLEDGFEPSYLSQLLRSWIVVIVFNSITSKKIKSIEDSTKDN